MVAMVGVGCRATSVGFVRPATFTRLLLCCAAGCPRRSGAFSSSVTTNLWRAGSRVRSSEFGEQRNRQVAGQNFQGAFVNVEAIHVSGRGNVDSPLMKSMESKIREDLSAESVSVKDASGDGRHLIIDVVASVFEGKSAVNRQRLVYKAIWEEL